MLGDSAIQGQLSSSQQQLVKTWLDTMSGSYWAAGIENNGVVSLHDIEVMESMPIWLVPTPFPDMLILCTWYRCCRCCKGLCPYVTAANLQPDLS